MRSLGAVAVLGLACAHPSPAPGWADLGQSCPASAPVAEVPAAVRDSLPSPRFGATVDDRWAEAARELPGGFAGEIIEGSRIVFLVDTTQRDAALAALAARGGLEGSDPQRVRVRKVRWNFAQLYDWYRYLNLHVWRDAGVVTGDIDESNNRITYGVMGESGRRRLERLLAQLRPPPPCFLVAIEVVGPPPEKATERVPARLVMSRDTARVSLPDTVLQGSEFSMTVTAFAGGCTREAAGSDVSVRGLRARVTLYHLRRQVTAICTSDLLHLRQTVLLRFDQAGVATIELRGITNELDWGRAAPQWVVIERHVVVQ